MHAALPGAERHTSAETGPPTDIQNLAGNDRLFGIEWSLRAVTSGIAKELSSRLLPSGIGYS